MGFNEAALIHRFHNFQQNAPRQKPLAIPQSGELGDQTRGSHASHAARSLNHQHLGAQPRGADRSRHTRWTAPRHHQVVAYFNRQVTLQLVRAGTAGPSRLPADSGRRCHDRDADGT